MEKKNPKIQINLTALLAQHEESLIPHLSAVFKYYNSNMLTIKAYWLEESLAFCALVNQAAVLKSVQEPTVEPFLIHLFKSQTVSLLHSLTSTAGMLVLYD